jgi:surface antigen
MSPKRLPSPIAAVIRKPLLVALITTLLVITLPVVFALTPSVSVAQSTRWCQCTDYVANRFGLSGYPNAGDWDNGYLAGKGFRQINSPQNGAIVVLNPNTAGAFGVGHVGVVEQYTTTGNSLKLNIRGTNQPGATVPNEFGCNNVTIWSNSTNVINNPGVTYWVRNRQVSLRTFEQNKYFGAEGGGGSTVYANRDAVGPWEITKIIDLNGGLLNSGDVVNFATQTGYYVVAEGGGGSVVNANRTVAREWEEFVIFKVNGGGEIRNGDVIALRVKNGQYVVAEGGGGTVVNANRNAIGPWEKFIIEFR